jgi:hypothetical protein
MTMMTMMGMRCLMSMVDVSVTEVEGAEERVMVV